MSDIRIKYLFAFAFALTLNAFLVVAGANAKNTIDNYSFRPSIKRQFSFIQGVPFVRAALDGLAWAYDQYGAAAPAALPPGAHTDAQAPGDLQPGRNEISTVPMDTATAGVFGSVAIPFSHLKALDRWKVVLAEVENADFSDCFGLRRCGPADARIVRAISAAKSTRGLVEKLQLINTSVNRAIAYQSDRRLYHTTDYWAAPAESIANGKGDCEDFAILKMAALHAAGVPVGSMSIVVLRDRRRKFFHAILAVATTGGDFVLDILNDNVRNASAYPDYQPLYSLSGRRAWIHGFARNSGHYAANSTGMLDAAPGTGPTRSLFADGPAHAAATTPPPAGSDLAAREFRDRGHASF